MKCCCPVLLWCSSFIKGWGLSVALPNRLRVLLASPCVLFIRLFHSGCKWEMGFVLWLQDLLGAFQPCSLVSFIKPVNYLAFPLWNPKPRRPALILLKPNQFVGRRLELSDHKQLLLSQPHYLPEGRGSITSCLFSAYFVGKSGSSSIQGSQGPAVRICSSFYIWNLRLSYQPVPRRISFSLL